MTKVKTNEGKIYEVAFRDKTEKKGCTYSYYVYATCEEHARQIVESYDENAAIYAIDEFGDCISQHYGPFAEGEVKSEK